MKQITNKKATFSGMTPLLREGLMKNQYDYNDRWHYQDAKNKLTLPKHFTEKM